MNEDLHLCFDHNQQKSVKRQRTHSVAQTFLRNFVDLLVSVHVNDLIEMSDGEIEVGVGLNKEKVIF